MDPAIARAGCICRLIDFDDWHIYSGIFPRSEGLWSPHTVDCFANFYKAKLPRFLSRFWNPATSGVDFFAQNLESENCFEFVPGLCKF